MSYGREVRVGLVLYGGVSLAIYENGIAQELYRAIRKDGVYALISQMIDSDVVVDVISGTSAGGDNGIMLAYALANGKNFLPSADLWRNEGDIERLMRARSDPNPSSVLNSTYYQDRLTECYATGMTDDKTAPAIEELDLFVTSTDANGAISTVYDELGHAIDLKNHRALFKLGYRRGRKNNFAVPPSDLATLSRMTSCFPVAFEPVRIGDRASAPNLYQWGKLQGPAVFLDGGILNNKPFTSTIDSIANRTATREVERFLIYVEPSPEQFAQAQGAPLSPCMVKAGLDSLISIPGYQSIAGDLAAIEGHNQRAAKLDSILSAFGPAPSCTTADLTAAGVIFDPKEPCGRAAYETARYIQMRDAAVEAMLDTKEGREYLPTTQMIEAGTMSRPDELKAMAQNKRRSGRILVQSFDAWEGSGLETLRKFDVFFRMRRSMHLSNSLMRAVKSRQDPVIIPLRVWNVVNHFFQTYEIVRWAMIGTLTANQFDWEGLSEEYPDLDTQSNEVQAQVLDSVAERYWGKVATYLEALLYSPVDVPGTPTDAARKMLYTQLEALIGTSAPPPAGTANLLEAIDHAYKVAIEELAMADDTMVRSAGELLQHEFCRFLEIDRQVFLLQVGSDFESSDLIHVVRFSPLDAQRGLSQGDVKNKVRGSVLAAFGGFFKKSWRANDVMVGRLDGACLLVECLLTKERLAALAHRKGGSLPVTAAQLSQCFPNQTPQQVAALVETINGYLASPTSKSSADWEDLVNAIVSAAHHEIFLQEYPTVVRCAIEQEADWGQYRLANGRNANETSQDIYDRRTFSWFRARRKPDQVIVDIAADAIAQGRVPPYALTPFAPGSRLADTFLDEIPEPVLQELSALAVIHLGKGLLASAPKQWQPRIERNKLYRVLFRWIAPVLYNFNRLRRTQPDAVIVANTVILAGCVLVLALAALLVLWGGLTHTMHTEHSHLVVVACAAVAVLVIWGFFLRR